MAEGVEIMAENGIEPGTAKFTAEVRDADERNAFDVFVTDGKDGPVEVENQYGNTDPLGGVDSSLQSARQHQMNLYRDYEQMADEQGMRSTAETIQRIDAQLAAQQRAHDISHLGTAAIHQIHIR